MLINTSRFEEAEAMVRGELAKDLEDPYLYLMLARVLCEQRKFQGALDAVKEAIALEPNDPDAYYVHAMICRDQGSLKEGLVAVERAISIDAEDVANYSLKAGLLLDKGKWKESLEAANQGLALDGDDESCLFYRGLSLAKLGREDEAENDSLNLLGIDADDAANHVSRGWVLLEAGRGADATRHFSEALRIDSTREDARAGLSEAVILSRPLAGKLMALIDKINRMNIWVLLVGAFVLGRVVGYVKKDLNQPLLGDVFDIVFWGLMMLVLSATLLFELILKSDKLTKHALSERRTKGLRFAMPFLVIAGLLFVGWAWTGSKSLPYSVLSVVSMALLIREMFESENQWVRTRMTWIAGAVGLVVIATFYSRYFVILPMLLEVLGDAAGAVKDGGSLTEEIFTDELRKVLSLRNWTVVWPSLAVVLVAVMREEISDWLQTKAPDEGWE